MPTARRPATFDDPPTDVTDPRELLVGYLDWYRATLLRKLDGLSEEQLRTPVEPLGWSPLGLVQHLGWVERRWLRWGLAAEDVEAYPPGDDDAEWSVPDGVAAHRVLDTYANEVRSARAAMAAADLNTRARVGGRFATAEEAPSLGRILFHLLQEYARHAGHLDIVRELIDGRTGE